MPGHPNPNLIGKQITDKNGKRTKVYVLQEEKAHIQQKLPFDSLKTLAEPVNTEKEKIYIESPYRFVVDDSLSRYDKKYDISDEIVQSGNVVDVLKVDKTLFFRRTENVEPRFPTKIRVQFNRKITEKDVEKLTRIIGYASNVHTGKKNVFSPVRDSEFSFVLDFDIWKNTKMKRSSIEHIEGFEEDFKKFVTEGTPVRKTNRSGPATKNTRLIEGFQEPKLALEIFYDGVYLKNEDVVIDPNLGSTTPSS